LSRVEHDPDAPHRERHGGDILVEVEEAPGLGKLGPPLRRACLRRAEQTEKE